MKCIGIILPTDTVLDRQCLVGRAMAWVDEQQRLADHAGVYLDVVFNPRMAIDWTFSKFNSEVDPKTSRARTYLPESEGRSMTRLGATPDRGQVVASQSTIYLNHDCSLFGGVHRQAVVVMPSGSEALGLRAELYRWDPEKHVYPNPTRTYTFE